MDVPLPERWAQAAPNVLPALRPPTAPPNAWLVGLDRVDAQLVRRPLVPFVDVVLTLDLPELRLFLNRGHLDRWQATPQSAFEAALKNVAPTGDLRPWPEADGVWALHTQDGQPTARLALPGWLRAFRDQVRGDPVAVAPDATTLWVSGTESGLPLQRMLARAFERYHSAGSPISPAPIVHGADGLAPWHPPAGHPLVHQVGAAHRFLAGHEYRAQQDSLERWLLDHDQPTYPASYHLLRHRDGRVVSFACWPDGPTLLPHVDLVYLGPPGDDLFERGPTVPSDDLRALGLLGEPEPLLAPWRYRLGTHPAADRLRDRTVDPRTWIPPTPRTP